jgi:transcriptional regulator with XRE-family HTH domain
MKTANTASRLKEIMDERRLRQVDILNAAKPYCEKYGIKLGRNDLSQYVSGKVEPGQEKLTILGLALNVSETWLMGYDVSPSRDVGYSSVERIDLNIRGAKNGQQIFAFLSSNQIESSSI